MQPPGIGHNSDAAEGRGWRRHAWKRARRELVGARVPIEIVRIRVRRATTLGLTYPQYASVLLGSGRDIVGFLFTVNGLQLRLRRELEAPAHVCAKLSAVTRGERIAFAPSGEPSEAFCEELKAATGARFDAAAPEPEPLASWTAQRQAVRAVLRARNLPADGVIMIGAGDAEHAQAEAGFLARFIATEDYFAADAR